MTLLGGITDWQSSMKLQKFSFLKETFWMSSSTSASSDVKAYLQSEIII
jgi:hypothetical protein